MDSDDKKKRDLDSIVNQASMLWLEEQLTESTTIDSTGRLRQDWALRRAAAREICARAGILEVLRGLSLDGEMRPPPPWPETDVVPVGGGPGFLDVEVRTMYGMQKHVVALRMVVPSDMIRGPERSAAIQASIGEAKERGDWELSRKFGAR